MKDKNPLADSPSYSAFTRSPEPSYKHTTYFRVYDNLFSKYRNNPITFVEIGVLNGGSLFMWRNFFGESARIIGIDLNPAAKKWEAHGFEIFIGSQDSPEFWHQFSRSVKNIDIVLDDGGHTFLQQIITTESLLDQINDGGMLVVEDTHTSYMEGFGDRRINFINYAMQTAHRINSRFSGFQPQQLDRRVWSVEVFESIVAFKINRPESNLDSAPIWNRRPDNDDAAVDFRHVSKPETDREKHEIKAILSKAFRIHSN